MRVGDSIWRIGGRRWRVLIEGVGRGKRTLEEV